MKRAHQIRRTVAAFAALIIAATVLLANPELWQSIPNSSSSKIPASGKAVELLNTLAVKGRAPKTGYARTQFGDGWAKINGCDMRNIILNRDLKDVSTNDKCQVTHGTLADPYTGKTIVFSRGASSSANVQIDHVVALGDAWQKGAQLLSAAERKNLANDPLELLAVDGPANQQKSDGDAATWLPPNKPFRCQYVARQITIKHKYRLWVTQAEKEAMARVLNLCPGEGLPS